MYTIVIVIYITIVFSLTISPILLRKLPCSVRRASLWMLWLAKCDAPAALTKAGVWRWETGTVSWTRWSWWFPWHCNRNAEKDWLKTGFKADQQGLIILLSESDQKVAYIWFTQWLHGSNGRQTHQSCVEGFFSGCSNPLLGDLMRSKWTYRMGRISGCWCNWWLVGG